MNKYLYLFGVIISFITFYIGWSHYQDYGFDAFNIGFMALTPIISFLLTLIWIRAKNKKEEEGFYIDKDYSL